MDIGSEISSLSKVSVSFYAVKSHLILPFCLQKNKIKVKFKILTHHYLTLKVESEALRSLTPAETGTN